MRSEQYLQGRRAGIKWAITFLHEEAAEMKDSHAQLVLNAAAFHMGVAAKCGDTFAKSDEGEVSPDRHR